MEESEVLKPVIFSNYGLTSSKGSLFWDKPSPFFPDAILACCCLVGFSITAFFKMRKLLKLMNSTV